MRYKNITQTMLTAAMALLVVLLSACIDDEQSGQPDTNPQALTAQMWVSLERATTAGTTRQGATVVQQDGTFRGLKGLLLIPYRLASVPASAEAVAAADLRLAGNCELGAIAFDGLYANSSSHLYNDVQFYIGTNAFLLYAEAIPSGEAYGNGSISATGLDGNTPAGISFSPEPVCNDVALGNASTQAQAMAIYLTGLLNTATTALKWSDVSSGLLEGLYNELKGFTTGNSRNLQAMLQNIYSRLQAVSLTGDQNDLRNEILSKIRVVEEKAQLPEGASYADYPSGLGLPDGAALLAWDNDQKKFVPQTTGTPNNVGSSTLPLGSFVHPLPLYYRANTGIKVSNSLQGEHYEGKASWDAIKALYTDGQAVTSVTRSVALDQPAQYAVGRLDVLLKASASTIKDYYNNEVNMGKVKLTGIIVTGQRAVDYQFTPSATDEQHYTIYDRDMLATLNLAVNVGKTTADADAQLTHTLVLQTPPDEEVCLYFEFLNDTGQDIAVHNGLVPTGCHFYLCGVVTPAAGQSVFEQDHVATITGTVSTLSGAYNALPPRQHAFGFDLQAALRTWNDRGSETHPVYNW